MLGLCRVVGALSLLFFTLQSPASVTVIPENAVSLLKNRIRIDKNVQEVTFWIHRRPGSRPAILVKPDGSKLYENRHPDTVHWLHTEKIDIISVEAPMRGPWQVLGSVLKGSQVVVISNVNLQATRLDRKLYHNETIKVTGRLLIDDKPARDPYYLSTATLRIDFQHHINESDPNAVQNFKLVEFQDDGKGLDEVPNDGIVSANLHITAPPGRYFAAFVTGNDVFVRGYRQEVWVYPNPVTLKYKAPETFEEKPQLIFEIDPDEIKPETAIIQGEISDKSGLIEKGVIWASQENNSLTLEEDYPDGVYSADFTLYGVVHSGREVIIGLPPFSFQYRRPLPPPPEETELPDIEIIEEEESSGGLLWVIIVVVVVLLLGGGGGAFFLLKRKNNDDSEETLPESTDHEDGQKSTAPTQDNDPSGGDEAQEKGETTQDNSEAPQEDGLDDSLEENSPAEDDGSATTPENDKPNG